VIIEKHGLLCVSAGEHMEESAGKFEAKRTGHDNPRLPRLSQQAAKFYASEKKAGIEDLTP
jgi:hypothetical protein